MCIADNSGLLIFQAKEFVLGAAQGRERGFVGDDSYDLIPQLNRPFTGTLIVLHLFL